MNKIAIIFPHALPVPAIKGGAVETLGTYLMDENETEKKLNLEIFSIWNKEAEDKAKKYTASTIHYIKVPFNSFLERLKGRWLSTTRKLLEKPTFMKKCLVYGVLRLLSINTILYISKVKRELKKISFQYLIVEGGDVKYYYKRLKSIPFEKKVIHLHAKIMPNVKLAQNFSRFFAISNYVKKVITKGDTIPEQNVKVIENCIDTKNFAKTITEEERRKIRNKLGIKEEDIVILFCGRTIPEKGAKELIQAYRNLKNKEHTKLVIVGNSQFSNQVKTAYDKELQNLVNDMKENIIFTGYLPNKELYKIYQSADISAVPSLWEEAFGLVLVEAMQSKLPVITTNSGAIPEIANEECAYIVERNEKIVENITNCLEKLINEPETRKKMGERGYQISQKYTTKRYYQEFVQIIQEMIKEDEDRNTNISKCS